MLDTPDTALADPELARFQELLRGVFRFEADDVDFGIYRILNAKREDIDRFIAEVLPATVSSALEGYASEEQVALHEQLSALKARVVADLGGAALDDSGDIAEAYAATPLGEQVAALKEAVGRFELAASTRAAIFNDLYRFFDRYYLDGDFVPTRRYGRDDAYVIPYRGENVLLHWANRDQYYVKSDDAFRAYAFRAGSGRVGFVLDVREAEPPSDQVAAEDEDSSKARFVVLQDAPLDWNEEQRLLTVGFAWRSLSSREVASYSGKQRAKVQSQINEGTAKALIEAIVALGEPCTALGGADSLAALLDRHIARFTKRNTADFFVHRDLAGFLTRELDFFITHEVLSLDDIIGGEATRLQLSRARVVRAVGAAVIAFLAQIEDLQRWLFEKPKLILSTDYCITIDRVDDDVLVDALASDSQRSEWQEMFGVTVSADAVASATREKFPHLVVDTRHFDEDFKWRLLAGIGDVDSALDGVLVKSESFHALRMLAPRYRDSVQATYIDPPFNTDTSQFLYRDSYRDSCWLTLLANRIEVAKPLLRRDSAFFVHLDENSNYYARFLLDSLFGRGSFRDEIIWRIGWGSGYKVKAPSFVRNHETIFLYGANGRPFFAKDRMGIPYQDVPIAEVEDAVAEIVKSFGLANPSFARQRLVFLAADGTVYKVTEGKTRKSGTYWVEDTWNANEYEQLDSNKIKRNAAEYTPNGSLLTQKPEQLLQRAIISTSNEGDFVLDFFAGSGTTPAVAKKLNRRFLAIEPGQYFDTDVLWRMKQVLWGKQVGISKVVGHTGGGFFKYQTLESYEDALENLSFDSSVASLGQSLFGSDYAVRYAFNAEARPVSALPESVTDPFSLRLRVSGAGGREAAVDLVETFNALNGLRAVRYLAVEHAGTAYRAVLGEQGAKRWAVIWRSLESYDEASLTRDRVTLSESVLPALAGDDPPDRIYVNAECALEGAESADALLNRLLGI
ncbi:MAG: DNA methyltransferase [Gaiellaceae bacterium]